MSEPWLGFVQTYGICREMRVLRRLSDTVQFNVVDEVCEHRQCSPLRARLENGGHENKVVDISIRRAIGCLPSGENVEGLGKLKIFVNG
jgi:hypothetical protein